ncbi:hypothetical protein LCGC14_2420740 [marine sediment metagenome]|uniref:Uncharacterized protein n=1 Tax=marine sediment metagenome TaxID=412755 RepID=A0A0F9BPS1_9ZZZZ
MSQKSDITRDAGEALIHWANDISNALVERFGKGRLGYMLILFDFGPHGRTFQWMSDARRASVVDMLRHLADHIEETDNKIVTLH